MSRFVIFAPEADYYNYIFHDITDMKNVEYINSKFGNIPKGFRLLYRIYLFLIKHNVKLPFYRYWNKFYYNKKIFKNENLYFLFIGQGFHFKRTGYFEYLKKKYPKAKLIFYFTDKVDNYFQLNSDFSIEYLKKIFDLVFSFNKLDVKKYDICYYPLMASKIMIHDDKINKSNPSDIFFAGAAKDRLPMLHELYLLFCKKGYICDFYISEVDEKNQIHESGIHYNSWLKYCDILHRVADTRIIVEITVDNVLGYTMRYNEALLYGKLLLTNNPIYLQENKIENIYFFKSCSDINFDILEKQFNSIAILDKNPSSPKYFLKYIEECCV